MDAPELQYQSSNVIVLSVFFLFAHVAPEWRIILAAAAFMFILMGLILFPIAEQIGASLARVVRRKFDV